jgi:hypothetical protein
MNSWQPCVPNAYDHFCPTRSVQPAAAQRDIHKYDSMRSFMALDILGYHRSERLVN